jgi:hypothetical protein
MVKATNKCDLDHIYLRKESPFIPKYHWDNNYTI